MTFTTAEEYRSRELVDEMRRLQPGILINDRAGFPGDFGNPEGLMPTEGSQRAWELCHCSAAFATWTDPRDDPALFAAPLELFALLSDAAGLRGNFLLNIGPQADGAIPGSSQEQLRILGDWMEKKGPGLRKRSTSTSSGPPRSSRFGDSRLPLKPPHGQPGDTRHSKDR